MLRNNKTSARKFSWLVSISTTCVVVGMLGFAIYRLQLSPLLSPIQFSNLLFFLLISLSVVSLLFFSYLIGKLKLHAEYVGKLNKKLSNRSKYTEIIYQVSNAVSQKKSFEEVLRYCVSEMCQLIDWPVGHIYLPDGNSEKLCSSKIWYIADEKKFKLFRDITEKTAFPKGVGLPGEIWVSHQPVWIEDTASGNTFLRAKVCKTTNVRSAVGFPVLVNNEIIAILEFFTDQPSTQDEELLRVLKILSEQIGRAWEKRKIELGSEQLKILAHRDALTYLLNRFSFEEVAKKSLAYAKRHKCTCALLFVDLDNFKTVNDVFGHHIGDRLIIEAAKRLQSCLRSNDLSARVGGDEFAAMLTNLNGENDAGKVAGKIVDSLKQPYLVDENEIYISASIGIACYPYVANDLTKLTQCADVAMYRAKELGRNNYQYFSLELDKKHRERLAVESALRQAIEKKEFYLEYQPRYDLQKDKIVCIEALLRWQHPELGTMSPAKLIPIAEEIGLIVEIGNWIFRQACEQYARWHFPDCHLAINISSKQLLDENFFASSSKILQQNGINPERVEMELSESAMVLDEEIVDRNLLKLHRAGMHLTIDNFGTGTSSLIRLKHLPITTLKIARTFINDMQKNENDEAIVKSIIALAKNLKIDVVAEGVENQQQLDFLTSEGCHIAQGYLLGKPSKAIAIAELLGGGDYPGFSDLK